MTAEARKMSGFILLTMPSIIYGGYFLLTILSGQQESLGLTDFQKSMFRAGHAHAGVLVILSLLIQLFADHLPLSKLWVWTVRISFPLSAVLISLGFFASAMGQNVSAPNKLIGILYFGIGVLIFGMVTIGIGLIRGRKGE